MNFVVQFSHNCKQQHNRLEKGKTTGWEDKFTVPVGGELVILSKRGMAALLGDSTLNALSNYSSCSEDKRCEVLLSMERALGSLVHKRKRKHEDEGISNATGMCLSDTVMAFIDSMHRSYIKIDLCRGYF